MIVEKTDHEKSWFQWILCKHKLPTTDETSEDYTRYILAVKENSNEIVLTTSQDVHTFPKFYTFWGHIPFPWLCEGEEIPEGATILEWIKISDKDPHKVYSDCRLVFFKSEGYNYYGHYYKVEAEESFCSVYPHSKSDWWCAIPDPPLSDCN